MSVPEQAPGQALAMPAAPAPPQAPARAVSMQARA